MSDRRIVVLGCGRAGDSLHLPVFLGMESCEVLGVCDADISKAQAVARKHGLKHAWDSLPTALKETNPNVVSICSPPKAHFEAVEVAAEHGADIILEKPVALTHHDVQAMFDIARRGCVKLCAVHNYHFAPAMVAAMAAVRSGHLGEILGMSKIWTTNSSERMLSETCHWAQQLVGGRWSEALPHHIYQGLALLEHMELASVKVARAKCRPGLPADAVHIDFLSPRGFYTVDLAFSSGERYGVLNIFGTEGQLAVGFDSAWLWNFKTRDVWVNLAPEAGGHPGHVKSGHGEFLARAIGYLRGKNECPVQQDEVTRTVELTEQITVQMQALADRS